MSDGARDVGGVINKIMAQARALVAVAEFLDKPLVITESRPNSSDVRVTIAMSADPDTCDEVLSLLKRLYPDADIQTIEEIDALDPDAPGEGN